MKILIKEKDKFSESVDLPKRQKSDIREVFGLK